MAGAGKKRAKQARADNRSGNISGEFPDNGAQVNDARPTPPGFDGPADSRNSSQGPAEGSRGRQLSNAPPPSGRSGRSGSRAPSAVRPMLRDPAREPKFNRNIDLPGNAYNLFSQVSLLFVISYLFASRLISSLLSLPNSEFYLSSGFLYYVLQTYSTSWISTLLYLVASIELE
ncbi:hypothetical protein MMC24_004565 [Lignoscripta atroalba]|nr:hypothetical protein [Lignoscripta atroalba]